MSARELALTIAAMDHAFDQIICEYDRWVHVGLSVGKPRGELLTIRNGTGCVDFPEGETITEAMENRRMTIAVSR